MQVPQTRYAAVGEADVAYQVTGSGPDLLYCTGLGSNIEQFWDQPLTADFLASLASFSRLIMFDRRGLGASDGVPRTAIPTWEEWTEDIAAVLDAAGSEKAAILASLEAGPIALLYAVSHPERVRALVLFNTSAKYVVAPDYPIGYSDEFVEAFLELLRTQWGQPELMGLVNPSVDGNRAQMSAMARLQRTSTTPRTAAAQYDYILRSVDVRDVLPLVQVPTLVMSVCHNAFLSADHGRYLAEHIDGANFVEVPGGDTQLISNVQLVVGEVAEFLTGTRPVPEIDRILATVLFTDIVRSTEHAAGVGDTQWRRVLDHHDRIVRDQLAHFQGREVNTTGDGFVASFDGPARAVRCAHAILDNTRALGIELRAGLHTGECEVRGEDLGGLAVHIAARVGDLAAPGEVLVSSTVKDLVVGSGIEFEDRGDHELKGVPGSWKLFAVMG